MPSIYDGNVFFLLLFSLWFGCLESQSMLIFLGSCLLELWLPSSSWSAGLLLLDSVGSMLFPIPPKFSPSHCSLLTHIATHVKRRMQWMGVGSSCLLWFWLHLLDDCKMLCLVKWLFFFFFGCKVGGSLHGSVFFLPSLWNQNYNMLISTGVMLLIATGVMQN